MKMDFSQLEQALRDGRVEEAMNTISELGKQRTKEAVPLLIKYLKLTDNSILRNEIAIALSDIGSQEAVEPLIEMLKDPKTLGNRGTLLFALRPFDYTEHLDGTDKVIDRQGG
ncbi:HEAT repeat domain-containing protein [Cohnella kolymensis]|uniref:HEAT repeat domain-containing protein n=1 Tax=Cohnella kolymensis TaxID=1590652 RepID=UPI000696B79B|nr:HEAT repeat domain-containing protein [Cohnella kolymensis]